jgi:hypothetical protein
MFYNYNIVWNWRTWSPYGNEGGEANKEKGQYMFSDQLGFIFLNMKAESEERRGCPTKALCKG